MSITTHYQSVTKVTLKDAKLSGGTETCAHVFAVRDILITMKNGETHTITLFADTVEELEMREVTDRLAGRAMR